MDGKTCGNRTSLFSYVPQSVHLIDGSIKDNITLGNSGPIDLERLSRACEQAALSEFISTLDAGIETSVGENGSQLSGGQKQRIGFARALYHNKDILVLDEATSALDTNTEKKILQSISNLSGYKTVIIISHKLSSLKFVDKLIFLKAGKLISEGSFKQVTEWCPEFKGLLKEGRIEGNKNE